jgi:ribonuclease T2
MAAAQQYVPAIATHSTAITPRIGTLATTCFAIFVLLQLIAGAARAREPQAGMFDYYALALSWSPTYCQTASGGGDREQCAPGRRFAFVVHGLWPQFDKGWPENCATTENRVPEQQIDAMIDIMPSRDLVIHEWKKHGSCSGLGITDYFAVTRQFFAKVKIPARYLAPNHDLTVTPMQIVADFVKTNRELTAAMLSVQCGNRSDRARLSELRLCFGRDGAFRACGENERRQCRAKTLILPRVR